MNNMNDISQRDVFNFISASNDLLLLRKIVQAAQSRRVAIGKTKARAFRRGDPVEFTCKDGLTVKGTFVRLMRKNCEVTSNTGQRWTVASTLLRPSS